MTTRMPSELRFLLPDQRTHVGTVLGSAGLTYAGLFVVLLLVMWARPPLLLDPNAAPDLPPLATPELVYIQKLGLSGGGGGGGNRSMEPVMTSPIVAVKPIESAPSFEATEEPVTPPEPTPPAPQVDALPVNAPLAVIAEATSPGGSLKNGVGGAGGGKGTGNGPGDGPGLGPGEGPNTGGGPYRPGNGVIMPALLFSPKPSYTAEAMLRRIQGVVGLSCVVLKTGDVSQCTVVKSIDSNAFGLDDEALKTAARFRFKPGTKDGAPVPVQINIELVFNMR